MRCSSCGGRLGGATTCPQCGAAAAVATETSATGLLLPSGPRGALSAVLIAALLFGGVWLVFDRATGGPPAVGVATPSPQPAASPSPAPSPSPSPTPALPTPSPTEEPDPIAAWEPVLDETSGALVDVIGIACDDTPTRASGFLVNPRRVVTAAHLVDDAARIRVRNGDEGRNARVLGLDPDLDIAVLRIPEPLGSATLEFVERPVAIGQRIAVMSLDDGPTVVPGRVSGVDVTVVARQGPLEGVVRTNAAVERPWAGAPLVAVSGRVGGVVLTDHVSSAVGELGFALPGALVAEHVADWTDAEPRPLADCDDSEPDEPDEPEEPEDTEEPEPEGSSSEWIAILESLPTDQFDREDAERRARSYRGTISHQPKVLNSSDWSSLNPNYWVVYTGPHGGRDDARSACAGYGSATPACYARELAR